MRKSLKQNLFQLLARKSNNLIFFKPSILSRRVNIFSFYDEMAQRTVLSSRILQYIYEC